MYVMTGQSFPKAMSFSGQVKFFEKNILKKKEKN